MIKKSLITLILLVVFSCGKTTNDNIYKTKGGEYASKTGNFVADFPTEPKYSVIDNKLGLDEFQIHIFRSTLGVNKLFILEYVDYPEHMIKSMTDEQIYTQSINNLTHKMEESFFLDYQESIEHNGLSGEYYVLKTNQELKEKGVEGMALGRIFRVENRVYNISYLGENDKNIDSFIDSFRLLK
ncbi:hypothetical protein AB9K26_07100 [Psychroserpens sp. XS_ASV72]|uniref:hypothetical protein n=1 Tax=Psychroserpens sp. XS_ASV72 TaxID=3241293 RepID=UPI003513A4C9